MVEGTPFDGGCFKVRIVVTPDYPNVPPKCKMFKATLLVGIHVV